MATPAAADDSDAFRPRDLAALLSAKPAAAAAARALLGALLNPTTDVAELERRSRAAYDAIGILWERSARLTR